MFATFHVVKIRHQSFQDGKFVGFIIPRFLDFDGKNKDGMLMCSVNTIRLYLADFSPSSKPFDTYLCQLSSRRSSRKPLVGWGRWSACVERLVTDTNCTFGWVLDVCSISPSLFFKKIFAVVRILSGMLWEGQSPLLPPLGFKYKFCIPFDYCFFLSYGHHL